MSTSPDDDVLESEGADLQMTMAASVVLEHLPKDAARALDTAGELDQAKGISTITMTRYARTDL